MHFRPEEFGAEYHKMDPLLLVALDRLRDTIKAPIVIHPDPTAGAGHAPNSQHPAGHAVDCHAVGLSLLDFWLWAERFPTFAGVGVYPFWTHPGLHLDTRAGTPFRARWWRDQAGVYRALDEAGLRELLAGLPVPAGDVTAVA